MRDYLSVILQYGYIIHRHENWRRFTLRLIQVLPGRNVDGRGGGEAFRS